MATWQVVLKLLEREDVDVSEGDASGRTGLHLAARKGSAELCRALLTPGQQPKFKSVNSMGARAASVAEMGKHGEMHMSSIVAALFRAIVKLAKAELNIDLES